MLIDFVNLVNSKPHLIWYESERSLVIPTAKRLAHVQKSKTQKDCGEGSRGDCVQENRVPPIRNR